MSPMRLHPNNIKRGSETEIPEAEAWMPMVKKKFNYNNGRTVRQRPPEGTTSHRNCDDRNPPITADHGAIRVIVTWISRPHRLLKTSRKQSKPGDLHIK